MNIICCQLDIIWENKPANHAKVKALIEASAPSERSLIILPEMFATGFSMNVDGITDSHSGATQDFLAELAISYRLYVMGGVVTSASDGKGRNECVVYSPEGAEVARYCKMHPFTLGGEAKYYEPGDSPRLFACEEFEVAPFICYDLRFPEVFRSAVKRRATLITVIANWPATREQHWVTLLQARAIENQVYIAGVNRCGTDPELRYMGRSMIIDPRGQILVEAGAVEGTISAGLDLQALRDYRASFPALADIRSDYVMS